METIEQIKVLHILNELKHSGAEVMLQLAHERFEDSGIESHILSTGNQVGEYATVLQETGYRIHHIPFRKRIGFFIDLIKLLRKEKFKAVHVHTERAFIWYVLMARLAGIPTVVRTFHSTFSFTSYLRWKRQLQRTISRKVFNTVHTAIGESVLAFEKGRFQNDCLLVRNWTDVDRFRPPTQGERTESRHLYHFDDDDDFVVVTVGTCIPLKDHLAILSAIKEANKYLDGKKIIFLHVGAGPMLEEEKSYVRQHGIGEYCRFVGTVNDVRPCLYAGDAFVMTSQWEGLGMAAVEAMSTGLPVILYDVAGLRDLLQDGKGGLLIEPDERQLAEALLVLNERPELRKKYSEEARDKIVRTYSLENSVDKLIQIYQGQKV